MCVAELNVTLQPCAHRWYLLVKPCSTATNLANCPERLRLEGWEQRHEYCPFCDTTQQFAPSTHRLFGSTSSASSVASSPTTSEAAGPFTNISRRGSLGTIAEATMNPLSRQDTDSNSLEVARSQRARDMNDRIYTYLSSDLHEVLPSARKNYPTYATAIARTQNDWPKNDPTRPRLGGRQSFGQGWKHMSRRFSTDLFKSV